MSTPHLDPDEDLAQAIDRLENPQGLVLGLELHTFLVGSEGNHPITVPASISTSPGRGR